MNGERVVVKLKSGKEVTGALRDVLPAQIQVIECGNVTELKITAPGIMLMCGFADAVWFEMSEIEKIHKPH